MVGTRIPLRSHLGGYIPQTAFLWGKWEEPPKRLCRQQLQKDEWCWRAGRLSSLGHRKPSPHASNSYGNSHPNTPPPQFCLQTKAFREKQGRGDKETFFSSSSWNLPQFEQVKSSKTIQFPHPVTIQVTQSQPSPSLSYHYRRIIKQLSVCYK